MQMTQGSEPQEDSAAATVRVRAQQGKNVWTKRRTESNIGPVLKRGQVFLPAYILNIR